MEKNYFKLGLEDDEPGVYKQGPAKEVNWYQILTVYSIAVQSIYTQHKEYSRT